MVLAGDDDVLRSGLAEDAGPLCWIKEFRLEVRSKVLVLEIFAIDPVVEVPDLAAVAIGVVPVLIPLGVGARVTEGGHRVDTPVNEDAELGIVEPIGCLVGIERLPGRLVFIPSCRDGYSSGLRWSCGDMGQGEHQ